MMRRRRLFPASRDLTERGDGAPAERKAKRLALGILL